MTAILKITLFLVLFTTFNLSFHSATASPSDHRYNVGDRVPLFVNKVGPLNNPSETYEYYDLPFCRADQVVKKKVSIGEVLDGDSLANAIYDLKFRQYKSGEILCRKRLSKDEVAKFRNAVLNDFYYQMYCDDLPMWGFIGKIEEESWTVGEMGPKYYLFKHVQFNAIYNGGQIIEVHAFSDPRHVVDISEDADIDVEFTYSVSWNKTSADFEHRMDRYSRASSMPTHQKIHWFSVINATFMTILLMGLFLVLFVRHLKNGVRRVSGGEEEEDNEVGWENKQSDGFRRPSKLSLFCAVLGVGVQLLTLAGCLFLLAFLGVLYPYNRGALTTSIVIIYSLTSGIAGYGAASFHSQFVLTGWERSVLLTGVLYLGPFLVIVLVLNAVAISFGATAALPFGTIFLILLLYTLVGIPLLACGGVIGYCLRSRLRAPLLGKRCSTEILSLAWYRRLPGQMFLAGLLPFSAIIMELHNLYASMWAYKIYITPGILFFTFVILIVLTVVINVCLTYFQLNAKDHEWWWSSILRGGSTAIFMFVYCIHFYAKSNMSGFMQFSFFFGFSACLCYAIFLVLGAISFYASLMFVSHFDHAFKSE